MFKISLLFFALIVSGVQRGCSQANVTESDARSLSELSVSELLQQFNGWSKLLGHKYDIEAMRMATSEFDEYVILATLSTHSGAQEFVIVAKSDLGAGYLFNSFEIQDAVSCGSESSSLNLDRVNVKALERVVINHPSIHPFFTFIEVRSNSSLDTFIFSGLSPDLIAITDKLESYLLRRMLIECEQISR